MENQITDLKMQVEIKDDLIKGLTDGYFKDISHLKEMVFRKDTEESEQKLFDV
jgi:hypothetical protein